jgi:hypothetical protein
MVGSHRDFTEKKMPTKPLDKSSSTPVPIEYLGKWVAWSSDHSLIVAHGDSLQAVWKAVRDQNVINPIFEKFPQVN